MTRAVEALGIEFLSATVDLPAGSVDAVVCHHVLEHVVDPPATLIDGGPVRAIGGRP